MQKTVCLLALACLFALTSCGVTPMLNPPVREENMVREQPNPANVFSGTWFDAKDGRTVTVRQVDDKHEGVFAITVLEKPNDKKNNTNPLPFTGFPVRYEKDGDLFFMIFVDMGKVREMAGTSELLGVMTHPHFHLVKPEFLKDGRLVVSFVNWMKKENDKDVVTDPGIKVQPGSNLVLNSTDELVGLIRAKKYVLAETIIFQKK